VTTEPSQSMPKQWPEFLVELAVKMIFYVIHANSWRNSLLDWQYCQLKKYMLCTVQVLKTILYLEGAVIFLHNWAFTLSFSRDSLIFFFLIERFVKSDMRKSFSSLFLKERHKQNALIAHFKNSDMSKSLLSLF
jgi:hypothetical protein